MPVSQETSIDQGFGSKVKARERKNTKHRKKDSEETREEKRVERVNER